MQSPAAVATLKRLKDERLSRPEYRQDVLQYGLAALIALGAIGIFWSAIASTF